jgi:uncharacterized protein with HEPN domain
MLDAAREAVSFAAGKTKDDLFRDRMLVLSLTKEIEIIGEAANRVSKEIRAKCTAILWEDVIEMRHHLVHVYFDVDLNILWDTVTKDLPPLIAELEKIIAAEDRL